MNTLFIPTVQKRIAFTALFVMMWFGATALSAHASTDTDRFAQMEAQLGEATIILNALLASLPAGDVLGVATTAIDVSLTPSKDKNVITLQAQLRALMLQRDNLNKKVAEINTQIVVLRDKIQKITKPTPLKPTPRFNGYSAPGTPLVTVSAVFGAPKRISSVIGPVLLGKINWGDAGDSESVFALVTGTQMFVNLKHTYKAPGTYTITLTDLNGKTATQKVAINQVTEDEMGPVFESAGNEAVVIKNSESTATDDAGRFTAKFELTANDTDVYVPAVVIDGGVSGNPLNWGIAYSISAGDGKESRPGTRTATLSSTADKSGNFFVINEGETRGFTLSALFDPTVAGVYELQLGALNWAATANAIGMKQVQFTPQANFVTNKIQISN